MVLESLVGVEDSRLHPYKLFFLAAIGTTVAIIITYLLNQKGFFLVLLVVLSLLPIMLKQLRYEEKRKESHHFWRYLYKLKFIHRHRELVTDYFYIILGVAITIAAFYIMLPPGVCCNIFSDQIMTISQITKQSSGECGLSGSMTKTTGRLMEGGIFSKILFNNIGVVIICFAFSLFYSSGAIFLISWNASVLGIVVGQGAKQLLGLPSIPLVLLSYLPHGIPEFLGYILAGIAGGILSVALARHKEEKEHFMFVLKDSLLLLCVSLLFVLIGTIIEVSVIAA
ncbi:MAG: stage II sporulation protein M [Candidatus Aenigmarchaeota archaeon]|nr:stage II sporulation protein M [Candidatus Aenigmarchaeota archaeon]